MPINFHRDRRAVVGELHVREGTAVKSGDVLIRLDDTITRANLALIVKSMDEFMAQQARLKAEQDGREQVTFPEELTSRTTEPIIVELMTGEVIFPPLRGHGVSWLSARLVRV